MKKNELLILFVLFLNVPLGFSQYVMIDSTSFEEVVVTAGVNDGAYVDVGDPTFSHDLINNPLQSPVNLSGPTEWPVFARYIPYNSSGSGLTADNPVGLTNVTDIVGEFSDGVQGYQFLNIDGNMILETDFVNLTDYYNVTFTMDVFINEAEYEGVGSFDMIDGYNDSLNDTYRFFVLEEGDEVEFSYFDHTGVNINDAILPVGEWSTVFCNIPSPGVSSYSFGVQFRSNSVDEVLIIDNLRLEGILTEDVSLTSERLPVSEIQIFPNPLGFQEILTVSRVDNKYPLSVKIHNYVGELVYQSQDVDLQLDLTFLPTGVYFIEFADKWTIHTKKLVVN